MIPTRGDLERSLITTLSPSLVGLGREFRRDTASLLCLCSVMSGARWKDVSSWLAPWLPLHLATPGLPGATEGDLVLLESRSGAGLVSPPLCSVSRGRRKPTQTPVGNAKPPCTRSPLRPLERLLCVTSSLSVGAASPALLLLALGRIWVCSAVFSFQAPGGYKKECRPDACYSMAGNSVLGDRSWPQQVPRCMVSFL